MPTTPVDSTKRFSDRVANYVRYRPTYPEGVLAILRQETGLTAASVVADIGSGTGISSDLFLRNGNAVFGVEPNAAMRRAAEEQFGENARFQSVAATAEATTLKTNSVDFVVAGQAFHWFDAERARQEFARILRFGGWVVLLWNARRTESTEFLRDYENMLEQFATDYQTVRHENIDDQKLRAFFADGKFTLRSLANEQRFDFAGLKGRLLSSSYAPTEGHPHHRPMLDELERLFNKHARQKEVCFEYDTEIYFGHVA